MPPNLVNARHLFVYLYNNNIIPGYLKIKCLFQLAEMDRLGEGIPGVDLESALQKYQQVIILLGTDKESTVYSLAHYWLGNNFYDNKEFDRAYEFYSLSQETYRFDDDKDDRRALTYFRLAFMKRHGLGVAKRKVSETITRDNFNKAKLYAQHKNDDIYARACLELAEMEFNGEFRKSKNTLKRVSDNLSEIMKINNLSADVFKRATKLADAIK